MSFITVEYPQVLTPFDTIIAYTSTVVLITFSLSELSLEASLPLPCRPDLQAAVSGSESRKSRDNQPSQELAYAAAMQAATYRLQQAPTLASYRRLKGLWGSCTMLRSATLKSR
jgi:hypothetical protein